VLIEGHTDSDPIRSGEFKTNQQLSVARAINTYRALLQHHAQLNELRNANDQRILSVSGYGEDRPIMPNDSDVNKRQNRRIELRIIMAAPGVDTAKLR
jgi:flagellar motor protein MotB